MSEDIRHLVEDLTRPALIEALRQVQHFQPPRPTRQDKSTLVAAVMRALASERYQEQMRAALKDARKSF